MQATLKPYTPADFLRVRDFLLSTYASFATPTNWRLERLEFCRYFVTLFQQSLSLWEENIGIWEDEGGKIVAVVNSEGELSAEAYFQVGSPELPVALLEEMFQFAEDRLSQVVEGRRILQLRIPAGDERREAVARQRGYTLLPEGETFMSLPIDGIVGDPTLPPGFILKDGTQVSDEEKALAHVTAFEYQGTDYATRTPACYRELRQAPDYRPEFDLYAVHEASGEIASFGLWWLDPVNHIAVLEPLGTNPKFRQLGLARAVIAAALQRLAAAGVTEAFVGSGQDFYKAIGFRFHHRLNIWEKAL